MKTLIRGEIYPSQTDAARAIGVHVSTVNRALDRGTEDNVGLGPQGHSHKPCTINGQRYPSRASAARALGVTPPAICRALSEGRAAVRQGGKGSFA